MFSLHREMSPTRRIVLAKTYALIHSFADEIHPRQGFDGLLYAGQCYRS